MKDKIQDAKEAVEIESINTNPQEGLTKEQVQLRIDTHAVNQHIDSSTKSVKQIIQTNTFTYFNLIFTIIAILLVAVGSFRDLTFFPIIVANTLIGIIQELRSKNVLDKLTLLNEPKVKVIRDGVQSEIPADELVLDDIILFSSGNQIPADSIILSGEVKVNESLLTGETDEISKTTGAKLLSGSFLISGSCIARIEHVGEDSYISQLTLQATKSKEGEQSEMIRSLDKLVKIIGIIILPIGIALLIQQYIYSHSSMHDSITSMVAAIIGMIPEGLYLLASVAMAVSAVRLAKHKVLIHDMKCIETLARVNVLCVDKTGTITEPKMTVNSYEPIVTHQTEKIEQCISDFVQNMSNDNATMEALQRFFTHTTGVLPTKVIPFSSATKYSAVQFGNQTYVLGAPEFVLREQYHTYKHQVERFGCSGKRVLIFAEYHGILGTQLSCTASEPLAFILLSNPVREGAKETFEYFTECGVDIKVISGDNPVTVSEVAKEAGIQNANQYIDATTLKQSIDYQEAVQKYTVFGRVTPYQKLLLVKALKSQKKTVAMTGDGVNDVLALKNADCSIAMASGSEAASHVAQLVLLDSDFTKMPYVVMEGRRVVNNIERTASLYLVKNIFSMLLAIFSVILMFNYPLEPSQVSLISLFTIGIPSFILALEPNKDLIHGHFLVNVFLKALPAGLTDFLVVSGLVLFCREFHVATECLSTSCTVLVAIVGFMILYLIAQPMTRGHRILMAGVITGWLFCMIFIPQLFAITGISKQCAMLTVVFAIITEPALRYLNLLEKKLQQGISLLKSKIK